LADYSFISERFPLHISVNQIFRHFPAHRHDFLEFSLVIGGEGYEIINGEKHAMRSGTCTFLLPYQVHEIVTLSAQPLRLYNCIFDMNILFRVPDAEPGLRELVLSGGNLPSFIHLNRPEDEGIARILEDMLEEYAGKGLWRNGLLLVKLAELLIRFDRLRRRERAERIRTVRESPGSAIWQVVHYIHTNYREPITLSALAARFGISRSHLSEEIKRCIGLNFVRFLHEIRINHALSLLVSTSMDLCDIAAEVGFGSYKTFCRIFRELKGVAPGEYRNRFRSGFGS